MSVKNSFDRIFSQYIPEEGQDRVYDHENIQDPNNNRPVHIHMNRDEISPEVNEASQKESGFVVIPELAISTGMRVPNIPSFINIRDFRNPTAIQNSVGSLNSFVPNPAAISKLP